MTRLFILPLIVLSVLFLNINSQANVLVNDAGSNAGDEEPFTSAVVPSGSGQVGDYELIFCSILPDGPGIVYSDPTPGTWDTLNTGISGEGEIALGIWGRFTNNAASEDISCNWNIVSAVFTTGSFRYNDVDPDNPIIAVACNSGLTETAVAPSVISEPGSQVVRIFASLFQSEFPPFAIHMSSNDEVSGSSTSEANEGEGLLILEAKTQLFIVDAPTETGEDSVNLEQIDFWRACTIAIRMAPTNVPTMNEWGLISFAAFAGIAGFWFLRRRQVTA